ncbi:hypothetical protein H5410_003993 [Solanum commersonii]|uniref:Endonuclease/exonuclease/phosphatase domain-containing protein n=1 Tax=Solanum commersonii TaxID=4109 RepID=A0A9J6B6T2_SOLCO|nr:hypothetical protein H5410_003993 [Solanum commersonii]
MDLNKRHHYSFIALMEPFQSPTELDQYKRKLGFEHEGVNYSGKNWHFWRTDWDANIILNTMQQITIKFKIRDNFFLITAMYARCIALERLELWEELEDLAGREHCPWVVGGDFNFTPNEALDFHHVLLHVRYLKYVHHVVNLLSGMGELKKIVFLKGSSSDQTRIDHAPLHMTCDSVEGPTLKLFWFLNFWSRHKYFKKIVEDNWSKLKKIKKASSTWSRTVYGDIFQQIATIEDVIKVKEAQMEIHPSESNRAGLSKAEQSKFFHSYVKGKRKKLHISKIEDDQGIKLQSNEQIGRAAVHFFEQHA